MAEFLISYKKTMSIEGAYSNDADDSGGETWKGISRNNFPDWDGWCVVDGRKNVSDFPKCLNNYDVLEIQVQKFYKSEFWDKFRGDVIQYQDIADELFEQSINLGIGTANKNFQTCLTVLNRNSLYPDLVIDGAVGNTTIKALQTYLKTDTPDLLVKLLNRIQGYHYINLALRKPTQRKYIRGWATRC